MANYEKISEGSYQMNQLLAVTDNGKYTTAFFADKQYTVPRLYEPSNIDIELFLLGFGFLKLF